jgi:hypothetical protein
VPQSGARRGQALQEEAQGRLESKVFREPSREGGAEGSGFLKVHGRNGGGGVGVYAGPSSCACPYSPKCVELDFSHLGIWHRASAKESINAPGTFCGLPAHTDPQKVSDLQGDRSRLLCARGGGEETLPKGRGPDDRVRSLRLARFGALRASLPRSEQQGAGASSCPLLARLGDEHTYPFRSQMAKVERRETVRKGVLRR